MIWGGGHHVNLLGLKENILLENRQEPKPFKFEEYITKLKRHDMVMSYYNNAAKENQLFCYIPLETEYTHGGRQSKVRRSRRLHRRTTRRTRRR